MTANVLLTPSVIAKEALRRLENNLVMANLVHRAYESEFAQPVNGYKKGSTVTIRKPVKYTYRTGAVAQIQTTVEPTTGITVSSQGGVDLEFSSADLTLKVNDFGERYLKSAMSTIANQIDMDLFGLYKYVPNWVGTPGEIINSFADFGKAPERMTELAVPSADRCAILSPSDYWGMLGSFTSLFAKGGDTAETALRKAMLGTIANVDTYEAQNLTTLTTGTADNTTPLTDGAAATFLRTYGDGTVVATDFVDGVGTSTTLVKDTDQQTLVTNGWDASATIAAGQVFTLAGVYAVNPVSRQTLPFLRQFTVVSAATASGGGAATLTISPAIIASGPYQTVSAGPTDDNTITLIGSASTAYRQNLFFHKNALALCMVPMELPEGAPRAARESYEGLSIRVVPYYDGTNDVSKWRFDVLYGVKAIYPELAARASGTA